MAEGDVLLLSKIDTDDELDFNKNLEKKKEIKERNDYYQYLISSQTPPLSLNSTCLRKINSKEVFEKVILNSGKHLSTLIPEFKITRDFVFNLLKNYMYFDLTEEESKFLLQKYFSDTIYEQLLEEEVLDLNNNVSIEIVESEFEEDVEDIEDCFNEDKEDAFNNNLKNKYPDESDNDIGSIYGSDIENDKNENTDDSGVGKDNDEYEKNTQDFNKKDYNVLPKEHKLVYSSKPKNINYGDKKNLKNKEDRNLPVIQSSICSTIPSMPTDKFFSKRQNVLADNNMTEEKINETKEIKNSISMFLKNALEKRSGIDKKTTIIQFLYKNNFKGKFDSSFFDIKDERGSYIFDQNLIDEWYNAIEQIEDKQKATFECSQLIISASLFGIECLARKLGIKELSSISSEIKDPTNLPKNLESTKKSLTNLIDNNIPNFFALDLLFFIGNVYIKNKVGISPL